MMIPDLFQENEIPLSEGAMLLKGFASPFEMTLIDEIQKIIQVAPFRHMVVPNGHTMSVAMTNCGEAGWITDKSGYRYASHDPLSKNPWPAMPEIFYQLAVNAAQRANFKNFKPTSCLINLYDIGARMALHQDKNENLDEPVVSVSLGLPATFLFGGLSRKGPTQRICLNHSDVVVWGGPARLNYHGILPIKKGSFQLLNNKRINLTFRNI